MVGGGDRRLRRRARLAPAASRRVGRGRDRCARRRPKNSACRQASWSPRAAATPRSAPSGSARSRPGEAFISLGTATQLIVATEPYLSAPEKLVHSFAHALPGRWYAMAAMLNGAGALAFAARLVGSTPDALEREAAEGYRGPGRARCSCPISPASGRRSTTLTRAACCSA